MRTTLDIDDDVLSAVKQRAREQHRTAGAVISDLARLSLTAAAPRHRKSMRGFRPLPADGTIVTNELIEEIREDEGI